MKAMYSSDMFVSALEIAWCHELEDHNIYVGFEVSTAVVMKSIILSSGI
jgi:hypothetical protein